MIDLDELENLARAAREDVDGPEWQRFWDQLSEDDLLQLIERVREAEAATDGRLTQAELEDIAESHAFCADRLFIETELVDEIRAERDAAVAATEQAKQELAACLDLRAYWREQTVKARAERDATTEAQVEAAAEGMWNRYGDRGMFQHAAEHMRSAFRKDARAALVAAAGAGKEKNE